MNLPANLFSTAFRQQRLGFMLALLIGAMVYLGSLAMAAQSILARTSLVWEHDLQNRLTMEIPARPGETKAKAAERAREAVSFLSVRPGVKEIQLLPETETARLLEPWIEDADLLDSLVLPRLVDIEMISGEGVQPESLAALLKPIAGAVRFHRHTQGMAPLLGFLKGLGAIAALMLVLTGLSVVVIIAIICRAVMAVQHETIELLHYMGAADGILVHHFQNHIKRLAVPSSATGFFFAVLTIAALAFLLRSLGGLSLVSSVSWITAVGVMALVPLAAVGLAVLAARFSVQRLLRRWI